MSAHATPAVRLASETCDRCGWHAYTEWRTNLPGALPLTFCAHHDRERGPVLTASGWRRTVDERHLLTDPPATS